MIRRYLPEKTTYFVIFMVILAGLSSVISSTLPNIYRKIMDQGILENNINMTSKFLLIIFSLSVINSIIKIFNNTTVNKIGLSVSKSLKENVVKKVFDSPLNFFDNVSIGELAQRIKEVDAISSIFTPQLLNIIVSVITCIIALIRVLRSDFRFLFIYVIAFPMLAVISYKFSKRYRQMTYEIVSLNTKSSQIIYESIAGINEVKSYNLMVSKQKEIQDLNNQLYNKTKTQNARFSVNTEIMALINVSVSILVTLIFSLLYQNNEVSIGQYVELTQYTSLILAPAQLMSSTLTLVQPIIVLLKRLKFFDNTTQQESDKGDVINDINRIEFQDVSFSYGENRVLHHLNFFINEKEKILINGHNGSGKTTIIKLLLRLYDNYSGIILLNNKDSKEYSLSSIRNRIVVVFQDTFLFDASLFENIVCGDASITKNQVIQALDRSGFIKNMKNIDIDDLLQLPIIEGGKNFSGGQKRMIAIARALIKNPSVLVLDEPTTFLDIESKQIIIDYIKNEKDIILIIVSHDQQLTEIADKVVYL